jgi:hypothetical protein
MNTLRVPNLIGDDPYQKYRADKGKRHNKDGHRRQK